MAVSSSEGLLETKSVDNISVIWKYCYPHTPMVGYLQFT